MLNLNNFKGPEAYDATISYYGDNVYHITEAWLNGRPNGYTVAVEYPEDDDPSGGNYRPGESFAASTLATAIYTIEALENGEEV